MKVSLRTKIILITVAILLLTTGTGALVSGYIFSDVYSRALRSKLSLTGGFLASQMKRLLAMGIPLKELVGFEAQCQEIVKKHEVVSYAMVVDAEGKILFHNDPSQHGNTLSPARLKAVKDFKGDAVVFSEGRERYYESIIPVFGDDNRHIGDIIVGFPESIVSKETKRLAAYSAGVALIFFGIAVFLLVFALTSWISNPLVQLLGAVQELANKGGDFAGKVEIASRDEIGDLASAFNRTTEKLRQTMVSRDYADAIIEGMTDILIVTDRDFKIVQANRATYELLDYQNGELQSKDIETVFMADKKPLLIRLLKDLSENAEMRNQELSLRTREGKGIPVLFSAAGIKDKEGRLFRVVHVGKDITELKRAEGALRESEDRYRDLVEYSQVILCTHDLEGSLLSVNQSASAHLKYDINTLITMKVQDILVPETKHLFDEYISRIRSRGMDRGLMLVQTAEGEKRLFGYNNTLRTEGVTEPIVRGMIFDVTGQKRQEKERERLIQELQEALAEVKQLSGLLPVCASCKKVRDDRGYWRQIESYIREHSEAEFTHSLCPECEKKLYPDYFEGDNNLKGSISGK